MNPIETDTTNLILTAPEEQESIVGDLPCTRYHMSTPEGDIPCIMSCWELDEAELELIKKTGKIYFHTFGETHPPIMLTPIPIEEMAEVNLYGKE